MAIGGKRGPRFLDRRFFLFVLGKVLAEAERFNEYMALLLISAGDQKGKQAAFLGQVAQVLESELRQYDYLGRIETGTLAISLLHANAESAPVILERLKAETLFHLSGNLQEALLKTSYAVYPSEANSLDSLCQLASQRLSYS